MNYDLCCSRVRSRVMYHVIVHYFGRQCCIVGLSELLDAFGTLVPTNLSRADYSII